MPSKGHLPRFSSQLFSFQLFSSLTTSLSGSLPLPFLTLPPWSNRISGTCQFRQNLQCPRTRSLCKWPYETQIPALTPLETRFSTIFQRIRRTPSSGERTYEAGRKPWIYCKGRRAFESDGLFLQNWQLWRHPA